MTDLKHRISQRTPKWFRRIIAIGLTLAAIGASLLTAEQQIPDFVLPALLHSAAQWMMLIGLVAAAVSKTAKEDE